MNTFKILTISDGLLNFNVGPLSKADLSLLSKHIKNVKKFVGIKSKKKRNTKDFLALYELAGNTKIRKGGFLVHYYEPIDKKDPVKKGFYLVKVTSVKMDMLGEDNIRISNGQYSYRVSGTDFVACSNI